MPPLRNKKCFKRKEKNNKVNKVKIRDSNSIPAKTTTCLSKREVSGNWLAFVKSNGVKGKVLNFSSSVVNDKKVVDNERPAPKTSAATKVIALDCEMVSDIYDQDMLARVSLVNYRFECIYDKYVKPTLKIGDYRTRFSGIREQDLEKGDDFENVCQEVKGILYNKILVGHALQNDFKVLKFGHHKKLIRDTSLYGPFREVSDSRTPSLKKLAKVFLSENIQEGEHSSVEDAKTAMKLYKKCRHEWETSLINEKWKKGPEVYS